jgi:hypothetical protein
MNFIGEINDTTEITALRIRTPIFKDDDTDDITDDILNKNNINITNIFILIFFCFLVLYFLY